jgi:hypothetical protein
MSAVERSVELPVEFLRSTLSVQLICYLQTMRMFEGEADGRLQDVLKLAKPKKDGENYLAIDVDRLSKSTVKQLLKKLEDYEPLRWSVVANAIDDLHFMRRDPHAWANEFALRVLVRDADTHEYAELCDGIIEFENDALGDGDVMMRPSRAKRFHRKARHDDDLCAELYAMLSSGTGVADRIMTLVKRECGFAKASEMLLTPLSGEEALAFVKDYGEIESDDSEDGEVDEEDGSEVDEDGEFDKDEYSDDEEDPNTHLEGMVDEKLSQLIGLCSDTGDFLVERVKRRYSSIDIAKKMWMATSRDQELFVSIETITERMGDDPERIGEWLRDLRSNYARVVTDVSKVDAMLQSLYR